MLRDIDVYAVLTVNSSEDARLAILQVQGNLATSYLSDATKNYLRDLLCETLALWQNQLALQSTKSFKAERLFSGDNYRISLRAGDYSTGLIKTMNVGLR